MNDRYLYRAKHIHALPANKHLDGTWIEGYLCNENYIYSPSLEGEFLIDPSTICQCTGLRDKNGKLIFENDIVSGKMYLDHGQWGESVDDKRIVEWDDAYARFIPCSYMKLDKYDVIGNIFDNPELLEVGE